MHSSFRVTHELSGNKHSRIYSTDDHYIENFQIMVTFSYWLFILQMAEIDPVYMVTNYLDYFVLSFAKKNKNYLKNIFNQCRRFAPYNVLTLKTNT